MAIKVIKESNHIEKIWDNFKDDIKDYARDIISDNESEYFDGWTSWSEDDYDAIIDENSYDWTIEYLDYLQTRNSKDLDEILDFINSQDNN